MLKAENNFHAAIVGSNVLATMLLGGTRFSQSHEWHKHGHATQYHDGSHTHPHPDDHSSGDQHADDQESEFNEAQSVAPTDDPDQISLTGPRVEAFGPFAKTVSAHIDGQHLVVESNGLPEHQMMVGIVSWQQQVPLPQPFTGENAWRLPLRPLPATRPASLHGECSLHPAS